MLQSLKLELRYSNAANGSVKTDILYPYFCRDSLINVTMSNSSSTAAADLEQCGSIMEALVELKKKATLVDIDCN